MMTTDPNLSAAPAFSAELVQLCRRHGAIPLDLSTDTLTIAVSQPQPQRDRQLSFATGYHIDAQIWPSARLEAALNPVQGSETPQAPLPLQEPVTAWPTQGEGEAPVIQFIDHIIDSAIQRRASDIHFEPHAEQLHIRLRIDGVLQPLLSTTELSAAQIVARLKIISQLDIAERRLPQDGQLTMRRQQRAFSMRIATLPTQYGEKAVLRLQENQQHALALAQLGFNDEQLQYYRQALESPQGLILVTGPTGSGKTVTLYSGLQQLDKVTRNICSVEDPIELPLQGISQTAVNPKCGLTFATILRALLRQDPDVIMVGEIRDQETAEIAVNAAQTGHLVLSTLHCNSASEAVLRLQQMGIPSYLIASSLKLVIAQRLLRRLCSHCKQPVPVEAITPPPHWSGLFSAWRARGCSHCFSGYYGRVGLYETLYISPQIQHSLLAGHNSNQLESIARKEGSQSLWHNGLQRVHQGMTSQEELFRVVSPG
ncbi:MAG: type II secretion system protein GspE [Enterobacteriaceae bacterium]